jgi:hypothetical protein
MTHFDIARQRLANQGLIGARFRTPAEVVRHHVAVQAQDYRGGLWAVGVRTETVTEAAVESALEERSIVRTWPMRGTLHLVAAEDVRWLLPLLTPRIVARAAGRVRQLGLVTTDFTRARKVFEKALGGGKRLTRSEMYELLESSGIVAAGQRGIHILWQLAQEGVLCCGPRQGKQPTFVLLDEWLPPSKPREREEAIAELARRYFESHGPATTADFVWWSGLGVNEAKAGLGNVKTRLASHQAEDRTFWGPLRPRSAARLQPAAHVLPPFDELLVAYKDRSASADADHAADAASLLSPTLALKGHVQGTWRRSQDARGMVVLPRYFSPLKEADMRSLAAAVKRYGLFLGVPARLA